VAEFFVALFSERRCFRQLKICVAPKIRVDKHLATKLPDQPSEGSISCKMFWCRNFTKVIRLCINLSLFCTISTTSPFGDDAIRWWRWNALTSLVIQFTGAKLQALDKHGRSAVHCAAKDGAFNVLHWLLETGLGVNLADGEKVKYRCGGFCALWPPDYV